MAFDFPADVRGWLAQEEGRVLWELARERTVLEIGSYCGRSTICLAQSAKKVHAVDWHRGDSGVGNGDTLAEMWKNLKSHRLQNKVVLHVGRIGEIGPLFHNEIFDMVFIDGSHNLTAVTLDTHLALRVLRSDGVLVYHDWDSETVRQGAEPLLPHGTRQASGTLMWTFKK